MLPGDLSEMTQVHIHMPHDLQVEVLLLVVDGRAPDDAIQFLHEVPPVLPLEHGEASILCERSGDDLLRMPKSGPWAALS